MRAGAGCRRVGATPRHPAGLRLVPWACEVQATRWRAPALAPAAGGVCALQGCPRLPGRSQPERPPACAKHGSEHSHRPDPAGLGPSGCAAGGAAANGSRPGRLPTVFFERAGCELSALPGASVLNPRGLVRDVAIDMIPATVMVRRWRRRRWCGATAVSAGPAAAPQSMPLAGIA